MHTSEVRVKDVEEDFKISNDGSLQDFYDVVYRLTPELVKFLNH
jgi:hypothetical protein